MILDGASGRFVVFFDFLFSFSPFLKTGNNWNELLFARMVGAMYFSVVRADSDLKEDRFHLAFKFAFWCSAVLFAFDELAVKYGPGQSWKNRSDGICWSFQVILENGGFNVRHFWAIEVFFVGAIWCWGSSGVWIIGNRQTFSFLFDNLYMSPKRRARWRWQRRENHHFSSEGDSVVVE